MAGVNNREAALEQAAVALIAEAKKGGVDLSKLATAAVAGIVGNAIYTSISDHDLKEEACLAVEYIVGSVEHALSLQPK
jgi:predicted secreted Zn-dependent protease